MKGPKSNRSAKAARTGQMNRQARRPAPLRPETALEAIAVLAASSLPAAIALRIGTQVESLSAEGIDLEAHLEAVREKLMQEALDRCDGVQTKAAEILRMSFRSFRYYRKKCSLFRESDEKGSGIEPAAEKDVEHRAAVKAAQVDELKRAGLL